jgi:hypothetical protein
LALAGAAALAAVFAGAALAQAPPPRPQGSAKPPAARAVEVPEIPPLADLKATRERPLFVRSRRPPAVVAPPAPREDAPEVVASEEAPAELIGIVIGPERTYAILKDHATKEVQHLQKGEKIEDWSLDEIAARHIVLRRGSSKIHVDLFDQKEADASKGKGADDDEGNPRPRRTLQRPVQPRFAQPQRRRPIQPQRRPPRREP